MKHFILSILIASFLIACGYAPPVGTQIPSTGGYQQQPQNPQQPNQFQQPYQQQPYYQQQPQPNLPPRDYYDEEEEEEEDDEEDKCRDDEDCEDICDDLFKNSRDEKKCGKLTENEVKALDKIFEKFEDPDEDDLEDIDEDDLKEFLRVSIDPIIKEAKKYSRSEVEDFLIFLIDEEDVAELLIDEDDDFELLEVLLENLKSDTVAALGRKLDDESFIELAVDTDNEDILLWIHEYLVEGSGRNNIDCESLSGGNENKCIFDKYCRIISEEKEDDQDNLFDILYQDFSEFKDIVEALLTAYDSSTPYASYCKPDTYRCNSKAAGCTPATTL